MNKTIYFHIGTVKTGSTLIQKTLWENRELLKEFNFSYYDQVEPKLRHPRYANAEFLFDANIKISDEEVHEYIKSIEADNVIISEEGLWANMDMLSKKAFEGFNKKIILYVRKPVELIAAWTSENAEPYNIRANLASTGLGIVPVEEGVALFTNMYSAIFKNFFAYMEKIKDIEIIVRPYDRRKFENGDIFRDFLKILEIDSDAFLKHEKFQPSDIANISKTRKFCDVSTTVWEIVQKLREESKYSDEIVEYVYKNCKSGDDRSVIDTLDYETVLDIDGKLKFIEDELSQNYLNGELFFDNCLLPIVNSKAEYVPLSKYEVKKLIYEFFHITYNYNIRYMNETLEINNKINQLRDLALDFENEYDIDIAYKLMEIAYELRPYGPFIEKKYFEYKKIIENLTEVEK